jgi:hypothetical protein
MAVDCDASTGAVDTSCGYVTGDTFAIAVHATAAGTGYAGYQTKAGWTDDVLDYLPGDTATENQWPVPCSRARIHLPSAAAVVFSCSSDPTATSSYIGPLVRFTMQCEADGVTSLTLIPRAGDPHGGSHFVDSVGGLIDPLLTGASVECGPEPTATATATATATVTATASPTASPTSTPKNPDGDTDGDTIANSLDPDDDNDGCLDIEELGMNPALGGLRNPHDPWDFYDVPAGPSLLRDDRVTILDVTAVVPRFGSTGDPGADPHTTPPPAPAYHPAYDRTALGDLKGWQSTVPDGIISIADIGLIAGQFSHTCLLEP